jgi:hypothetical protein
MKICSYCGAEYADDVVMCATDHTPLAVPPVSSSQEFNWSWVRSGARLFSVFLVGFAFFNTWLMLGARIDTPQEFVSALWQDRSNAFPLPFGVFLLVLNLPRPKVWTRAALAILAGFVLWFFIWQWLVHCDYANWQGHGIHVIHVDDNQLVYEVQVDENQWERETIAPEKSRGIPMLIVSSFTLAAVSACLVQLLFVTSHRASRKDSDSTVAEL